MHDAITEVMVELAARNILRADGVSWIEMDGEWQADVARYRDMCAKHPDYVSTRGQLHDAFRAARAALSAALNAADVQEPVAWTAHLDQTSPMTVGPEEFFEEPVAYDHTWRCDECGCHSYAVVEERKAGGIFGPSATKRCVNCKKAFAPPVASPEAEGNAARQIERFAILRNLGENHGGEKEAAPDQASIDAAIAFIRRWGLPDNALTTLGDEGCAVIELHGENYADITFHVSARPSPPRIEALEARRLALEITDLKEVLNHAPDPRHFTILVEALSEIKASSDGESDQPIADIVAGCLEEILALIPQKDKTDD